MTALHHGFWQLHHLCRVHHHDYDLHHDLHDHHDHHHQHGAAWDMSPGYAIDIIGYYRVLLQYLGYIYSIVYIRVLLQYGIITIFIVWLV